MNLNSKDIRFASTAGFVLIVAFCIFVQLPGRWIQAAGDPQVEGKLNIIETTDLSLSAEIDQNDLSYSRDFVKAHWQYRKPISKEEYYDLVFDAESYGAQGSGKTVRDLRENIISDLNIGFLLNDLDRRELSVVTTGITPHEFYTEKELLFKDPRVGTFAVLLLIPNQKKSSYPAIIGLHGHNDSKEDFRDMFFGSELAAQGFVVIMPSFRAMSCQENEIPINEELALNGFTLMGLRIYESLLLVKYLKHVDFVDNIGVMGHSGGSDVAHLLSIISPDIKALAEDNYPLDLLSRCDEIMQALHCQMIPALAYYSSQINDLSNIAVPAYIFEYGYKEKGDKIKLINFFREHL